MESLIVLKRLSNRMASLDCIVALVFYFTVPFQSQRLGKSQMTSGTFLFVFNIELLLPRFGAFEMFKEKLVDEKGQLSTLGKLGAGLGAGISEAILAVTPMETVKVKFINDQRSANPKFKGFLHGVGQIIKAEGVLGVYKGVTATIMKQGSNQAIRFYVMETCKDVYKGGDPNKPVPKLFVGAFGAVAGAASVFGNTPIDVVKTRMQVRLSRSSYEVLSNITDTFYLGT